MVTVAIVFIMKLLRAWCKLVVAIPTTRMPRALEDKILKASAFRDNQDNGTANRYSYSIPSLTACRVGQLPRTGGLKIWTVIKVMHRNKLLIVERT